jgi:hypothetical protein
LSGPTKLDESKFIRRYMYGSTQREGFRELWKTWVDRWGDLQAADALLAAMCDFESRYQDLKRLVGLRRALALSRKRRKNARTKN